MGVFQLALLGVLAMLLIAASVSDWRTRTISNGLNTAIALGALVWWWAIGLPLWPGVGWQLLLALVTFAVFAGLFALGAMGGGDVKLVAALALWFSLPLFVPLLMVMAIAGGVLTLALLIAHRARRAEGRPEIPYGIAISLGGLWAIFRTIS
ncbi:MAG: prepilin peptidase [Sphingomonadaceae bacterium]|nr:prepilin peptidase [Sphingomonadaceae bacterium]